MSETAAGKPQTEAIPLNIYVHDFFSCFCPCNWGTRKRVDTAPKASGCFLGGTQEIFGAVSEDLLGGTGKAEDAKLQSAGIIPKQCPGKWLAEKGTSLNSVRIGMRSRFGPRSSANYS
jgi:hypothetical protein